MKNRSNGKSRIKTPSLVVLFFMLAAVPGFAASLEIDSLSGPVTPNEINSFIAFMQAQSPPQTPWGALGGTNGDHNEWADGTGGRDLEAMGEMFEVSSNMAILNQMISWSDDCVSQRNDLMAATNGGQRVMWTGKIDAVWCPNEPSSANAKYAGCENEDTEGHLAFCARLILQTPALWDAVVPDGDPYGYGATYFQRATNYLNLCDQANDEYSLQWFIQPGSGLIVAPTSSAWTVFDENVNANNRQMMFMSGFQRLAEAHASLGDNPARVAQYDAIVQTNVAVCLNGMVNYHPYAAKGQTVYDWGYYPTSDAPEATEIHAEYDIIGVWRAFNRVNYGFTLAPLVPFANTMNNVIYLGTNAFAGDVSGGSGQQSPIYSGWILAADWNPQEYITVAGAAFTNGWYSGNADIDAGILFMKNRRYLEFSMSPAPASQIVYPGAGTSFSLALAPLGGFTNIVNLSFAGLPSGATGSLSSSSINLSTLDYASTNVTFSVSTSDSTPIGNYTLSIIGTAAGVSHTNTLNLVVGSYALSAGPPSQAVSAGNGTSYTVSVSTNSRFIGPVVFGISGLPANASATFDPTSLNGAGNTTLTIATATGTPAGIYPLTIYGTNGDVLANTAATLVVAGATPVWTGASTSDSNWSDATNWGGITLMPVDSMIFDGSRRLNNTNDTAAGTTYSNLLFNAGAGGFVLDGNPVTLGGNITNLSANPQTLNLGLNFSGNAVFDGAGGLLIINGGLTNRLGATGWTTLTLAGSGQLADLFDSTSRPGGTNILAEDDGAAAWTLVDNSSLTAVTVPWVFAISNGTFTYGSGGSAPRLTMTTPDNEPSDNLVGAVSGATATFNLINGTLTTSSRFDTATAAHSTGIINQSGGTFNMGFQFQGANGSNPGEVSIVNVSGGTMNINGGTGQFYVASRATGSLTVSGSGIVNCGLLDISRNAAGNSVSSAGTVNLDGGTLMATAVTNLSANQETGGNPTAAFNFNGGTLLAKSGAAAGFFRGSLAAPVTHITTIVQAGGAIIDDGGNAITIGEPLEHDNTLGESLDGGLTKAGTGTLTLIGTNSYNGPTMVENGTLSLSGSAAISNSSVVSISSGATLDVSVRTAGAWTLAAGQTLTGNGTVKGNLSIAGGATFAPGGSLSTLVCNGNLTLNAGSLTTMELNQTLATNDAVRATGSLTLGGTLLLVNLSGTLTNGSAFKLFSAGDLAGTFTNLVPVIPAANEAWNTSTLALDGTLRITNSPTPPPALTAVMISGGNLIFTATNGPVNYPVTILASTNLGLPLPEWPVMTTTRFDASGKLIFTNAMNPVTPQQFYVLQIQ